MKVASESASLTRYNQNYRDSIDQNVSGAANTWLRRRKFHNEARNEREKSENCPFFLTGRYHRRVMGMRGRRKGTSLIRRIFCLALIESKSVSTLYSEGFSKH